MSKPMQAAQAVPGAPASGVTTRAAQCVKCGTVVRVEVTTAYPVMAAFRVYCDPCNAAMVDAEAKAARAARLRADLEALVAADDMDPDAASWTFAKIARSAEGQAAMARNPQVWAEAQAWDPKGSVNVYLWGGQGTGKTVLALALLMRAFGAGRKVLMTSGPRLARAAAVREGAPDLMRWSRVGVLLVDDITVPRWNTLTVPGLWEVLNYRHSHHKPTLITANADPSQFTALLLKASVDGDGDAKDATAASILDRMVPVHIWHLTGDSLRRNTV